MVLPLATSSLLLLPSSLPSSRQPSKSIWLDKCLRMKKIRSSLNYDLCYGRNLPRPVAVFDLTVARPAERRSHSIYNMVQFKAVKRDPSKVPKGWR